jgi:replicative DNA helicase
VVPAPQAEARVPPQDLEAEAAVLGSIMLDSSALARVLDLLVPEDFYRENNAQIYRAALTLFREGEPIDNVTVAAQLEKMGVLERVGGRAQLAIIQDSVPTAANAEYYARIVKAKAYKRRLIAAGAQVTALGYDESLDADEAVNQAQAQVYALSADRIGSGLERLYDLLKPAMDRIDAQMASGGAVIGIPSGFHDLDRMTNGFKPSDLVIVAGRPSMGKCLASWTLIDDPETGERITIEEAVRRRLGRVMALSPDGRLRPAQVGDWVDSGVQPCFRVRTRSGREVDVTGHHPFLTGLGWRPLHELGAGVRIAVPQAVPCFGRDCSLTLEEARRLGRALAAVAAESARGLPSRVWCFDAPRLAAFLQALLDRMARPGAAGMELTTPSRALARDLQHALVRFGIPSRLQPLPQAWRLLLEAPLPEPLPARVGGGGRLEAEPSDVLWEEIAEIESLGPQRVYDLTVPEGANFVAQDVLVHNTSFVLNIALKAAVEEKRPVAIFSLEMSKEQLVERMLCEQARIDAQRLHRGLLSDVEYERLASSLGPLGDAPIFIDDSPLLDDLTLRLKARQARSREGIEMMIVDYLQLMHGRGGGDDANRVQEVSAISRALKSIARELKIPVIAISQLSRAPEARPDKRPILSDLRESGCLTEDTRLFRADTGMPVTIRELLEGGCQGVLVWSLDERRRLVPAPLTRVFRSGIKRVFRLRLASGYEVKASANHRFLAQTGWRSLAELRPGQGIATPRRLPEPLRPVPWNPDRLALLAHLIAGAHVLPSGELRYVGADLASLELVERVAGAEFGLRPRRRVVGNQPSLDLGGGKRSPLVAWLDDLGVLGLGGRRRRVTERVLAAPDHDVASFLGHLWAANGGRDGSASVCFETASPQLAEDISLLLLRLGVHGRTCRVLGGTGRARYQVWVREADQLARLWARIRFHQVERAQLAAVGAGLQMGAVTSRDTLAAVRCSIRDPSELLTTPGTVGPAPSTWRDAAAARSGAACLSAVGEVGPQDIRRGDVHWDTIVAIEDLGEMEVYDGTVAGTHNFIADGIVAHNSIEQDSDIVMFLYRDDYYNREKSEKPGVAEVIVAKHRNGPTGTVELMFRKELTRFENLERRRPEPGAAP